MMRRRGAIVVCGSEQNGYWRAGDLGKKVRHRGGGGQEPHREAEAEDGDAGGEEDLS